MSNQLNWGKGGAELATMRESSRQLGIPILQNKGYETIIRFRKQLEESADPTAIAQLDAAAALGVQTMIGKVPALRYATSLSFNVDSAGALGDLGDIRAHCEGRDDVSISVKKNSKEKSSRRYHQDHDVSPVTGLPYSGYALTDYRTVWEKCYSRTGKCREREDLPLLVETMGDIELGEIERAYQTNPSALMNHFSLRAFGRSNALVEIIYTSKKGGYTHKVETDFPTIVDLDPAERPYLRSKGDKVVSSEIMIPCLTSRGESLALGIRLKNGNSTTHYPKTGTPRPFVKDSAKRYLAVTL